MRAHITGIKRESQGFTLLELSIVLVIVGLIIAGVMAGQTLKRSAEVQTIATEMTQFVTAMQNFQKKYDALPGDMADATSYWGADSSCPSTPYNTVAKQATCDGDGSGHIGDNTVSARYYEFFRAWQQLSDAGMTPGTYSGVTDATYVHHIGVNSPASRVSGAGWGIMYVAYNSNASWYLAATGGHTLFFGDQNLSGEPSGAALTTSEAYALDLKIDDGMPGTGSVLANPSVGSCTTSTAVTAAYNTAIRAPACAMQFKTGF